MSFHKHVDILTICKHLNSCKKNPSNVSNDLTYTIEDISNIGKFYFVSNKNPWEDVKDNMVLEQRQVVCLSTELNDYYTEEKIKNVLIPILCQKTVDKRSEQNKKSRISLRLLDWLVCNYSKNKSIHFIHPERKTPVNVFSLYKKFLRGYKRNLFDPFRRKALVCFEVDGKIYNTTVGQLNFLKFCDHYGILDYAKKNYNAIEKDMVAALSRSKLIKKITKAKRIKLSKPSDIQIQCNKLT